DTFSGEGRDIGQVAGDLQLEINIQWGDEQVVQIPVAVHIPLSVVYSGNQEPIPELIVSVGGEAIPCELLMRDLQPVLQQQLIGFSRKQQGIETDLNKIRSAFGSFP